MLQQLTDPFYQTLAIVGLFIIFFGLVSLFIKERLYLTESLVAIIIGIIFGPTCASIITPREWFVETTFYRILLEFSRIIISFQVMAVGLSIPGVYIKKHWRDILMFLGPIMCLMWAVSSFAVWLFSGLDAWTSLMIGACLAPTDPVLANAVIKGKFANRYIPSHLRNLLSVESGANDGLGFPFLMLPIALLIHGGKVGPALSEWFLITWVYEITFSIVIGIAVGVLSKKALEASQRHHLIDNDSFLVYSMAIAMATTGLVALISSDDLLAVFIAGNVFSYGDDRYTQATKESHFQEVIDMLFNLIFFILLGAVFPWHAFAAIGVGRLFCIAITILIFRRLPFVVLLKPWIPQLRSGREAFFAGWFGPMGVGAIFFAMVCRHHTELPESTSESIFTIVTFVVLSSIVIHGITVPITHVHLKNRARKKAARRKGAVLADAPSEHHFHNHQNEDSTAVDIFPLRDIPEPRHSDERLGRHKVADADTIIASTSPSHMGAATTTETEGITTEDEQPRRRHARPPYRMRPMTATDLEEEEESSFDERSQTTENEDIPNDQSMETFDGRTMRREQVMARLKHHSLQPK